jgi:molecular chaperone GrpE
MKDDVTDAELSAIDSGTGAPSEADATVLAHADAACSESDEGGVESDGDNCTEPSDVAALDEIAEMLAAMEWRLLDAFDRKLAFDAGKEKQIDRLHEELQGYRADLVTKAIRPVLQSLIRLHDSFGKILEALDHEDREQLTPERLIGLMRGFREDVELTLEENGVNAFESETETFDPRRQRAMRRTETTEPERFGKVAARLLPGFAQGDTLIEKERVAVYFMPTAKLEECN